jgi:hypothetical protein
VEEANCHGKSRHPGALLLEEPGELVDASVIEGVSGDAVPALVRKGLLQVQVIACTVSTAAGDLSTSLNCSDSYIFSHSLFQNLSIFATQPLVFNSAESYQRSADVWILLFFN